MNNSLRNSSLYYQNVIGAKILSCQVKLIVKDTSIK